MALRVTHTCTSCGTVAKRAEMMAKKVVFTNVGSPVHTIRSRTKEWLCPTCVAADPDWQLPPGSASPGYNSNNLARNNG